MFLSIDELSITNFESINKVKPEFSFEFNLLPKNEFQIRRFFINKKGNHVRGWIYEFQFTPINFKAENHNLGINRLLDLAKEEDSSIQAPFTYLNKNDFNLYATYCGDCFLEIEGDSAHDCVLDDIYIDIPPREDKFPSPNDNGGPDTEHGDGKGDFLPDGEGESENPVPEKIILDKSFEDNSCLYKACRK